MSQQLEQENPSQDLLNLRQVLGQRLVAARKNAGFDQRQMAEAAHVLFEYIVALEAGEYEALPDSAFCRAYIKNYARACAVSSADLLDDFALAWPKAEVLQSANKNNHTQALAKSVSNDKTPWLIGLGLLLMVLLYAVYSGQQDDNTTEIPAVDTEIDNFELVADSEISGAKLLTDEQTKVQIDIETSPETSSSAPSVAAAPESLPVPVVEVDKPEIETPVFEPAVPEVEAGKIVEVAEPEQSAAVSPVVISRESNADSKIITVDADGNDVIEMQFTEECWVEVRNAQERLVYGDLNNPNQTLIIKGDGPFKVLLGYAPGVSMKYNGEVVAIKPHVRNRSARLALGR